ncbi:MAG: SDR family NAD(P)-dependent oxidoreductase [Myxococcales bacterium]|nr:SDR family oxidoreductase [Myxococcales bacterium]HIK84196.1 SDR family oxidoreductase [Myxococcales bacterium]
MSAISDLFSLKDKNVVITGASSGLGHHFSGVLSRAGANVILGARREEKIRERVEELVEAGGQATGLRLDVRDANSIDAFLEQAEQAYGPIDVIINNAGVESGAKTYAMIDEEDWDFVMETNLRSVWRISKAYTGQVVKNGRKQGNIVNITSITDTRTVKGQFPYAVSKGAVTRMTQVMALEAARFGIRVNALSPGYFMTDVSRVLLESAIAPEFVKGIPMRRLGEFPDLDGAILLLASDASRYMSGSVIVVDGGHTCASL